MPTGKLTPLKSGWKGRDLAYLRDRLPEDDPFRRDFELGLALGYQMSLKVRSELHEAS